MTIRDHEALPIEVIADLWSRQNRDSPDAIARRLWSAFWRGDFTLTKGPKNGVEINRETLATILAGHQEPRGSKPIYPFSRAASLDPTEGERLLEKEYGRLSSWASSSYAGISAHLRSATLDSLKLRRGALLDWCRAIGDSPPTFWQENSQSASETALKGKPELGAPVAGAAAAAPTRDTSGAPRPRRGKGGRPKLWTTRPNVEVQLGRLAERIGSDALYTMKPDARERLVRGNLKNLEEKGALPPSKRIRIWINEWLKTRRR